MVIKDIFLNLKNIMEKFCFVFLCNKFYFDKFLYTCSLLITRGNYKGDICLVIGDDLNNEELKSHKFIKNFPISQIISF